MEDLKDIEIVFKQTQNNTEGMLEFSENLHRATRNPRLFQVHRLIEGEYAEEDSLL